MASLEPEFWKKVNGFARYEALVGHMNGLAMTMDDTEALIGRYDPPETASWQVPTEEELKKQLKIVQDSFDALRRQVRQWEAELIAKDWDAK